MWDEQVGVMAEDPWYADPLSNLLNIGGIALANQAGVTQQQIGSVYQPPPFVQQQAQTRMSITTLAIIGLILFFFLRKK